MITEPTSLDDSMADSTGLLAYATFEQRQAARAVARDKHEQAMKEEHSRHRARLLAIDAELEAVLNATLAASKLDPARNRVASSA